MVMQVITEVLVFIFALALFMFIQCRALCHAIHRMMDNTRFLNESFLRWRMCWRVKILIDVTLGCCTRDGCWIWLDIGFLIIRLHALLSFRWRVLCWRPLETFNARCMHVFRRKLLIYRNDRSPFVFWPQHEFDLLHFFWSYHGFIVKPLLANLLQHVWRLLCCLRWSLCTSQEGWLRGARQSCLWAALFVWR